MTEEEKGISAGEEATPAMNCRNCTHWNLRKALNVNKRIAMLGYGYCNQAPSAALMIAGAYCGQWQEAAAASVGARRAALGGVL